MSHPTAYHQLGRFIVSFQHAEAALTELLVLMVRADDEASAYWSMSLNIASASKRPM